MFAFLQDFFFKSEQKRPRSRYFLSFFKSKKISSQAIIGGLAVILGDVFTDVRRDLEHKLEKVIVDEVEQLGGEALEQGGRKYTHTEFPTQPLTVVFFRKRRREAQPNQRGSDRQTDI